MRSTSKQPQTQATVSELLRSYGERFTAAERKVVRVLQSEYPRAGLESLPTLAKRAGVSAPTVLRLLTKLGYGGYGEFQVALLEEVHERMSAPAHRSAEQSGTGDEVAQGLGLIADGIASTEQRLARADFAEVAALLADRRRSIVSLGGFESEVCSLHLTNLLTQVRSKVSQLRRTGMGMPIETLNLGKNDVLVVFDFRRYQSSTVESARLAAANRATVVVVTDRWLSPASEHAQHTFIVDSTGPGAFDSRTTAIAWIEVLVATVAALLGEEGQRRMRDVYALLAGSTWAESLMNGESPEPDLPGVLSDPREADLDVGTA